MNTDRKNRTAILAWGSLILEPRGEFDKQHGDWLQEGPVLPIEFSRISLRRDNALTLVIDPDNGELTRTWYALSKRDDPQDTVCDLRTCEGTSIHNIGLLDIRTGVVRSRWTFVADKIRIWLEENGLGAVVWTDLTSNYVDKQKELFSPVAAVNYINGLPPEGKSAAQNYIAVVPKEVVTPFRTAAQQALWFRNQRT
jgi:hypothetical protein